VSYSLGRKAVIKDGKHLDSGQLFSSTVAIISVNVALARDFYDFEKVYLSDLGTINNPVDIVSGPPNEN
jgi:hypothetical protein